MKFKFIFPTILGTVVENYNHALYGFSAGIIAHYFFPSEDSSVSLLKLYSIFIITACSNACGSILFGIFGDRYGRKFSLKISMFGIILPTILLGIMPGYEVLGGWAALFLAICRIFQGIFVAGESDGVRIFVFESLKKTRPNLCNSIAGMAEMTGVYLASRQLPAYRIPICLNMLGGSLF